MYIFIYVYVFSALNSAGFLSHVPFVYNNDLVDQISR